MFGLGMLSSLAHKRSVEECAAVCLLLSPGYQIESFQATHVRGWIEPCSCFLFFFYRGVLGWNAGTLEWGLRLL